MFPYKKINREMAAWVVETATEEKAHAALASARPGIKELLLLISPAAAGLLESIRAKAAAIRLARFGRTVGLYAPLYLSNACVNSCAYCGFRAQTAADRRVLSLDEAITEAETIRGYGIDSLLLVCGEDPRHVSVAYLEELLHRLRRLFSYVAIEIYPMGRQEYSRLFEAGVHGLTIYQETYAPDAYRQFHLAGPKKDYERRLRALEDGAMAGFHNIGIGALLGLSEWRAEAACLAAHAVWLRKNFWRSRIQLSFPRITAIKGGFIPPCPIGEEELEAMALAFRIVFPDADISISTRERPGFRERLALTCANRISAGSKVAPGSYALGVESLEQFSVMDQRSVAEVAASLRSRGLEPVFKDWDAIMGPMSAAINF